LWEVVCLKRGPFSLVSTTEELLGRKSSHSSLESQEYGCRVPWRWPRGTFYPRKLELTSPTSGGRSVGIVRLRTQATEFCCTYYTTSLSRCGLEYLHRSNASHKRRRKANPVPCCITGPLCS
jgi:hypothetical protein